MNADRSKVEPIYTNRRKHVMRGVFIIVTLIAMLIAVYLVAKNLKTDTVDGVDKVETIQKAKENADIVDSTVKKMKKAME